MGRFETAAEFYRFREPYPTAFFERVAIQLGLGPKTRMLDVACGPGNLAIGFAPFVGSCTAIDIESEMLRVARKDSAHLKIQFLQGPVEKLDSATGAFDFVTVGRAIHWLLRDETLDVFERVISAGGMIAVCNSAATDAECNAWTKGFKDVRRHWSEDHDESRYRPDLDAWFAGSRFQKSDHIEAIGRYGFTIDELIGRALSFSVTSPSVLLQRQPDFQAELRRVLEPFAVAGMIEEELVAKALIFQG